MPPKGRRSSTSRASQGPSRYSQTLMADQALLAKHVPRQETASHPGRSATSARARLPLDGCNCDDYRHQHVAAHSLKHGVAAFSFRNENHHIPPTPADHALCTILIVSQRPCKAKKLDSMDRKIRRGEVRRGEVKARIDHQPTRSSTVQVQIIDQPGQGEKPGGVQTRY